jgi:hypothetical protein
MKDAFMILAARSGCYPNISEEFFIDFCVENGIIKEFTHQIEIQGSHNGTKTINEALSPIKLGSMA